MVGIAIGMQFGYNYLHTGSVLGRTTTITPAALLASTNDQRAEHDLASLVLDPRLSAAAGEKANDMLERGYWDHNAPDGTEPWAWIDRAGYQYHKAGENLAKNFSTANGTVAAWMDSPLHRDNLLGQDYHDVGFATRSGMLDGEPTTITVAFYGERSTQAVAGASSERQTYEAPLDAPLTPASRIGIALQSLTPAAVTALALLFIAATVATTAHFYRSKLPRQRRESWRKHHGVAKAVGLLSIAAFVIVLYGGGQV